MQTLNRKTKKSVDGKRMSELLTDDEKDLARYLEKEMGTKIVQIDKNNEVWKRD